MEKHTENLNVTLKLRINRTFQIIFKKNVEENKNKYYNPKKSQKKKTKLQ